MSPEKFPKTPRTMDIEITSRCNLRCVYCSHFSSEGDVEEDLPTQEWLTFFRELGECSVLQVCLQGGEPFVREDLKEIIEGIVRNRMRFTILSNGTLITDETADFIASTGRCDLVQVSIDGAAPNFHDSFRGRGSFVKAMEGLGKLMGHGVRATARVTIHRKNVAELDEICRMLLEEIGLPEISTNSAASLGLCRRNADSVQLSPYERSLAMRSLLRLSRKYPGRILATAGPLAEARAWTRMERALKDGADKPAWGGYLKGCGGAMSKLAVRADGVLVPCGQLPSMELGRINQDDLRHVWHFQPDLSRFRERRHIPLTDFKDCCACHYRDYCTGSCPAIAGSLCEDSYRPSPDTCYRLFLEQGGVLPDEQLLMNS